MTANGAKIKKFFQEEFFQEEFKLRAQSTEQWDAF